MYKKALTSHVERILIGINVQPLPSYSKLPAQVPETLMKQLSNESSLKHHLVVYEGHQQGANQVNMSTSRTVKDNHKLLSQTSKF